MSTSTGESHRIRRRRDGGLVRGGRPSPTTVFIDPGSPWQNAWIESFNSRLRDEILNGQLFDSLLEAQVILADWRDEYNYERLHSSLGYMPPAEVITAWKMQHQEKLALAVAH